MAEYYLMSQLPSLDAIGENSALPITEERFLELCKSFLGKKAQQEINKLTLVPPRTSEKSSSSLIESWNDGERNLRLALGKVRADKNKKQFDADINCLSSDLLKIARTAVEMESPYEAEKFLNRYRLDYLESLRPMDTFSEESAFYYGLKLKLLIQIRQYDADIGRTEYKNIYNSIMNGDKSEVEQ